VAASVSNETGKLGREYRPRAFAVARLRRPRAPRLETVNIARRWRVSGPAPDRRPVVPLPAAHAASLNSTQAVNSIHHHQRCDSADVFAVRLSRVMAHRAAWCDRWPDAQQRPAPLQRLRPATARDGARGQAGIRAGSRSGLQQSAIKKAATFVFRQIG